MEHCIDTFPILLLNGYLAKAKSEIVIKIKIKIQALSFSSAKVLEQLILNMTKAAAFLCKRAINFGGQPIN